MIVGGSECACVRERVAQNAFGDLGHDVAVQQGIGHDSLIIGSYGGHDSLIRGP